jgi:arylsulfatase
MSPDPGLDVAAWELYDVRADASECHDLAEAHPDRLAGMVERWWQEAERNQVLPLDNRPFSDFVLERPRPIAPRERYVYFSGSAPVPEVVAANVHNRSHLITAAVEVGPAQAEGVLAAQGSLLGGWSLFLLDGELRYVHNYVGLEEHRIAAPVQLTEGAHQLAFRFTKTAEHAGTGALLVDGTVVAEGDIPRFTPTRFSLTGAGLTCGRDPGLPVTDDYAPPFTFTGRSVRVTIDVSGEPYLDPEAEAADAIARQ